MNFTDLLDLLGYAEGENLSICHQRPGGQFQSDVIAYGDDAEARSQAHAGTSDTWFGVNPVTPRPVDENGNPIGRGGADDVTRLAAIWCDLDVKPGACRDIAHAYQIIDALAEMVGTRPSAIVFSGHGLQPYWPVDDGLIADPELVPESEPERRAAAAAVLKRWGRLACMVADSFGAKIDRGVYDLARVLRVPGTFNRKGSPVPVMAGEGGGAPITIDELLERLDEAGIPEIDGDTATAGGSVAISAPSEWTYAARPCEAGYVQSMMRYWGTDSPTDRHPWLVAQATRIAAAHRYGCLTEQLHRDAQRALAVRFRELCDRTGAERPVGHREVEKALWHGQRVAAVKSEAQLATELGGHAHLGTGDGGRDRPSTSDVTPSDVPRTPPAAAEVGGTVGEATAGDELRIISASQISTTVPEWAWTFDDEGRIMRAAVTLFGGRPGAGKSTTGRWFAAGWTNGTLPGCWVGQPVNVAYIATEEAWNHTVVPSLQAAGADLDRVKFVQRGDEPARIKSIADETKLTALFRAHEVRAVFLDPLMGTINGGADINRNNEVREYLDPWVRIAEAIDGPVVGICHMTKAPTGDVVASITGSSAFGELARCVFGFAIDRDADDGTRVMSQAKNSAGIEGLSLAYRIGTRRVATTDGKTANIARFELIGVSEKNVRELLVAERSSAQTAGGDECARWLKGYLTHHGKTLKGDVVAEASELGYSSHMLKRACGKSGVKFDRTREVPSKTYWYIDSDNNNEVN